MADKIIYRREDEVRDGAKIILGHDHPEEKIIYTPGHSEDSLSFVFDYSTAIVGDLPPYSTLSAIDDEKVQNSYEKNPLTRLCHVFITDIWSARRLNEIL